MINRRLLLVGSGALAAVPAIAVAKVTPSEKSVGTTMRHRLSGNDLTPDLYAALDTVVNGDETGIPLHSSSGSVCRLIARCEHVNPTYLLPNDEALIYRYGRHVLVMLNSKSDIRVQFEQAFKTLFNKINGDITAVNGKHLAMSLPASMASAYDDTFRIVDPVTKAPFLINVSFCSEGVVVDIATSWAVA